MTKKHYPLSTPNTITEVLDEYDNLVELSDLSLEALGRMLGSTDVDHLGQWEEARNEVCRRCDNDPIKVLCLLKYHQNAFLDNPSGEHWSQLVAMMAAYQRTGRTPL